MNQTQRNFLIKKIQESVNAKIKILREDKEDPPSLSNYILHYVMSGNFEIISNDKIKEIITEKALNSKAGRDSWMSGQRAWSSDSGEISFRATDFFVLPDDFKKLMDEYLEKDKKRRDEINDLQMQADGLITRIQLASDKTLQTLINEIDDMGNISLMDTRLKALSQ